MGEKWLQLMVYQCQLSGAHGSAGGMTLRSTQIKSDGTLTKDQVIDSLVCDCCQTDIAQSDQGPVLVFRNRTKMNTEIFISHA